MARRAHLALRVRPTAAMQLGIPVRIGELGASISVCSSAPNRSLVFSASSSPSSSASDRPSSTLLASYFDTMHWQLDFDPPEDVQKVTKLSVASLGYTTGPTGSPFFVVGVTALVLGLTASVVARPSSLDVPAWLSPPFPCSSAALCWSSLRLGLCLG